MTCSRIVLTISACETSGACWVETTTVSIRTGVNPSYSTVTWLLASGRSQGIVPSCRNSVIRLMIRCASAIGSGISSGVSLQAKPNIMPWSPAPMSLPVAESSSTPCAMSGDCLPRATITAQVVASKPMSLDV